MWIGDGVDDLSDVLGDRLSALYKVFGSTKGLASSFFNYLSYCLNVILIPFYLLLINGK